MADSDADLLRETISKFLWAANYVVDHAWAFRRLFEYVEYKAEVVGIEVEQVDPAYTSQRCSKCGTTLRENRQTQARFCCQKCGYELNADYNAAKNIGLKYLRAAQMSSGGGAPVNVRLNRGTVNVNGEYSPAADGGQNGSPREIPTRNEANGDSAERSSADHSSGPAAREKKP